MVTVIHFAYVNSKWYAPHVLAVIIQLPVLMSAGSFGFNPFVDHFMNTWNACACLYVQDVIPRERRAFFFFVVLLIRNEPHEDKEKCIKRPLHNLPSIPHVIKVSKWERMKWEWRLLRVRESKRRILQGKTGYRQQNNFAVNVKVSIW